MAGDFVNFMIIYLILVVMFSIVANLNFIFVCPDEYGSLFGSLMIILDSSMGNYDFSIFDQVEDPNVKNYGKGFLMVTVIIFTILILNLIIAILSNTYNIFDPFSNALYLSKILASRDLLQYDEHYGAFLQAMSPLNAFTLPMVPFGIFMDPSTKLNTITMSIQYILLMMIMFIYFFIISAILLPFAYLKSLL